ncbi:hypothetical protein [Nocardia terpenica]|uniref:hypothetical protein n=1 Tax=Nocardia terpenica TaxID=455432 RepID=UPI000AEA7936|nr:hypothetical protein [Nocardia terpenica]NQE93381.1 hypothetical protein [Nocardia terpenica]
MVLAQAREHQVPLERQRPLPESRPRARERVSAALEVGPAVVAISGPEAAGVLARVQPVRVPHAQGSRASVYRVLLPRLPVARLLDLLAR